MDASRYAELVARTNRLWTVLWHRMACDRNSMVWAVAPNRLYLRCPCGYETVGVETGNGARGRRLEGDPVRLRLTRGNHAGIR